MEDFKNIEEVLEYIVYLNNLSITKGNLVPFKNFLKFSPEKLANKFELDELSLVKDFNQYKKEIHKKVIIYEKIKSLKKINPIPFNFHFGGDIYFAKVSVCETFFETKYKSKTIKFYPGVKYLYVMMLSEMVLFPNGQAGKRLFLTENEFNSHFIDMREFKINQILK